METNLKDALKEKLTEEEFNHLKTSFDTVGDIAILEIDEEIISKEKLIAETLLRLQKNIKVVCKKEGIHEGQFRTQKLKVLAGEQRKETICKENGIQLKLDVEDVYFSPRLSTERARIALLVKPKEEILCLFSGCGPYPVVIMKNQPDIKITSIELNPIGIKYQQDNLILNKSIVKKILPKNIQDKKEFQIHEIEKRIKVIEGDVNEVVPHLYDGRFGLKSSTKINELNIIKKKNPDFIELHLFEGQLENIDEIKKVIQSNLEIDFMLHLPDKYFHGKEFAIMTDDNDRFANLLFMLEKLEELKFPNILGYIMHPCFSGIQSGSDVSALIKNMGRIKDRHPELSKSIYVENLIFDFAKGHEILHAARNGINICFDLNHYFSIYKDNEMLQQMCKELSKHNTYFHIADSSGEAFSNPHTLRIGRGLIDFKLICRYIKFASIEVECKDYSDPVEMISSYDDLLNMMEIKKFDRILMPLPKSAEDFLDAVMMASKNGTIIHFYDFLNENEFHLAHEKIEKACKRSRFEYKLIDTVKCGQHAPHVYRICVDFQIIDKF